MVKVTRHKHLGILAGIIHGSIRDVFDRFDKIKKRLVKFSKSMGCRLKVDCIQPAPKNGDIGLDLITGPSRLRTTSPLILNGAQTLRFFLNSTSGTVPLLVRNSTTFTKRKVICRALNLDRLPGCSAGKAVRIVVGGRVNFAASPHFSHSAPCYSSLTGAVTTPVVRIGKSSIRTMIRTYLLTTS